MRNIQLIISLFILSVSFADDYVLEWQSPSRRMHIRSGGEHGNYEVSFPRTLSSIDMDLDDVPEIIGMHPHVQDSIFV